MQASLRLMLAGFVLASTIQISGIAHSQAGSPPRNSPKYDQATLGKLFDQYATIAGGWYLEQHCNHLSSELKREFDWNVEQTNLAMGGQVGPGILMPIQQSAHKVADAKPCGDETRSLVSATLLMSRQMTHFLTGRDYTRKLGLVRDADRIATLLSAQRLDDKCKLIPKDIRARFDEQIAAIVDSFGKTLGSEYIVKVRAWADMEFERRKPECDAKAQPTLMYQVLEARQLSIEAEQMSRERQAAAKRSP